MRFSHYDEEGRAVNKMEIMTVDGWKTVRTVSRKKVHIPGAGRTGYVANVCSAVGVVHSRVKTP